MKNTSFLIICVINILLNHNFILPQTNDVNFYEEASKIKTIKFDESILLGDISFLDIDDKKNLLLTDRVSQNVFLFSENGKLINTLSTEKCTPGFNWNPQKAYFNRQGGIVVINNAPWGYRFKSDGNCLTGMNLYFLPPLHLAFKEDGIMIGYYILDDGNHLKIMSKSGKEMKKIGTFPNGFKNLISRFEGGGLITDENDNIYQLNVNSPKVFKYSKDGVLIYDFMNRPSYLRLVDEDISEDPSKHFKQINNLANKTLSLGLFLLDKHKILVLLSKNKNIGMEVYNTDGKYLLKREIIIDKMILAAKDGLIYVSVQPPLDSEGKLPNPFIEIYKLK